MMNKGIVIENPIYPKCVVVFRGNSIKKCLKYFESCFTKESWDEELEFIAQRIDGDYLGITLHLEGGDVLIHLKDDAAITHVVHEAFHATEFQLRDYGIRWETPPNEPYAYYQMFLVKEIINNLYND